MKNCLLTVFSGAAMFVAGWTAAGWGASLQITPTQDTSIYSENNNSNARGNLFAGRTAGTSGTAIRRALMMFDIVDNIAAGSTINSVTLNLTQVKLHTSSSTTFELHRLSAAWGEGTSTGTGQGGSPTAGDATWNYRLYSTNAWTTAGGDFVSSSSGTALIGTAIQSYTFSSQAGLVSDVQSWLDTPASDFGWILRIANESTLTTAREFGSRESATPPTLTINFTPLVGTPAAWRVAASGNWSDGTRWNTGAALGAIGAAAVLTKATTAALTVTLDSPEIVGSLTLGNSASSNLGYTVSGNNTLTLNNSSSNATITVVNGNHAINSPVVLASNLLVTSPAGDTTAWKLSFGTASRISGSGKSLTLNDAQGMLILSGSDTYNGGTTIAAGTLVVTSSAAILSGTNLTVGDITQFAPVVAEAPAEGAVSSDALNAVAEPGTLALVTFVAMISSLQIAWRWRAARNRTVRLAPCD